MARGTLEEIALEVKRFKKVAVVGLSKNSGKTTVVNSLLRRLNRACVTTVGRDGEKKDIIFKTPKPTVFLPKENYAFVPVQIPLSGVKIVETFEGTAGKIAFVKAEIDVAVQTVRIGSAEKMLDMMNKVSDKVSTFLIDGAFDRMSALSISDAVILVVGTGSANVLEDVVAKAVKTVEKLLTPLAPRKVLKAFSKCNDEILGFKDGKTFHTHLKGVIGNENNIIKLSSKYDYLCLPGAVTDELVRNVKIPLVVPTCDKIFSEKGTFFVLKRPKLLGVAVNNVSHNNEVEPSTLINKLRRQLNDGIIIFDVLYDF